MARRGRDSGGGEDLLQLAGADHGVNFRNVLLDFVAIALDQASGDDQLLRFAGDLVLRHFEDRVHRLLLGGVDERAGVDHDDVGVFGAGGDLGAALREQAHHDFAVHQVLGTTEADEANFLGCNRRDGLIGRGQQGYRIVIRQAWNPFILASSAPDPDGCAEDQPLAHGSDGDGMMQ